MFEVGKKAICVSDYWRKADNGKPVTGPQKHEVLPVKDMADWPPYGTVLQFEKYLYVTGNGQQDWFTASDFRPIEDLPKFQEQTELQNQQERIEIIEPIFI